MSDGNTMSFFGNDILSIEGRSLRRVLDCFVGRFLSPVTICRVPCPAAGSGADWERDLGMRFVRWNVATRWWRSAGLRGLVAAPGGRWPDIPVPGADAYSICRRVLL